MMNPLRSLSRELSDIRNWKRRRRKLDRKTVSELISDSWLSYRYGISPLLKDVKSAAEAVARTVLNNEPVRKTARGSASEYGQITSNGHFDHALGRWDYQKSTEVEVSVRAGVLYEMIRSPNTFGVGTERIPVGAWEAIPLSFLVDWVFNVGSFIEAITPVAGVKRLGSWTTIHTTMSTTREIWFAQGGASDFGLPRLIDSDGRSTETYKSVIKQRDPGIQIGLAHKITPLKGDIGKKRVLDLLALSNQILVSR